MEKIKDWEKKYQEYDKNAENEKINLLKEKLENKTIKKEEYEDLKKAESIMGNIDKVSNIVELKNTLEEELKNINSEITRIKKVEEISKNCEKLEAELNSILEKMDKISENLKAKDLTQEEKDELNDEYSKLMNKRDKNNDKFQANQDYILKNRDTKNENFKGKSLEELEEQKQDLGIKIGKCHFVGRNLMNGYSWDSIQVSYNKDKKYTSKDKITEKFASRQIRDEEVENTLKGVAKEVKEIFKDSEQNEKNSKEKTSLVEQTKFEKKHPKLAKFLNGIKQKFNNIFTHNKNEEKEEREDKEELENREVITQVKNDTQRDEFMEYLKIVSEKGIEGAGRQEKEQKNKEAKRKLAENKRDAYDREVEKFGEDYAEKSYKEEKEDEIEI